MLQVSNLTVGNSRDSIRRDGSRRWGASISRVKNMSSIKAIASAPGPAQAAAYAGKTADEDILSPVLCWSVIEFDGDDEPDEVVGQIFDGQCITEATSVDDEEGFGEFVGYFELTKRGKEQAKEACEAYREIEGKKGKKRKKGKGKKDEEEVEESVDEEEEIEDGDEDEEEEEDFGDFIGGADEEEEEDDDDDDEEDDQ